ncbi:MAG: DNA replication/repair protein RecF [Thermomicrobiales bacterium]|nr:DNA replication/repair protein RecF [Thermomicrobiales bacterium]MCO5222760.1 DNA replication/repair protein RecF [Thermomicrobiales bacterium]
MYLTSLRLTEFRRYRSLDLHIPPEGFVLIGRNASGKSSMLEAISMLSTMRSGRAQTERELIAWESGTEYGGGIAPFARIEASVERRVGAAEVAIGLQLDPQRNNHLRKQISLNGKHVRAGTAVGTIRSVLFEPGDIELVSGAPSVRRRYLDIMLSQLDPAYLKALSKYLRIVEQRNRLIKNLVQSGASWNTASTRQQLDYWDGELIANGAAILARRVMAVQELTNLAAARFASFTEESSLSVAYSSTVPSNHSTELSVEDLEHRLSYDMSETIDRERHAEFRRGITLVGPHRDDLQVAVDDQPIGAYGSRGQQRLAVIALKLAETDLMTSAGADTPVLLLDDVFSELDAVHRSLLAESISGSSMQTIVTTTDESVVRAAGIPLERYAVVEAGFVRWLEGAEAV